MQDMIRELRLAYQSLHQDLEEEKRARKQLESQIQKLLIVTPSK
jgi:betaPIX coiled coil